MNHTFSTCFHHFPCIFKPSITFQHVLTISGLNIHSSKIQQNVKNPIQPSNVQQNHTWWGSRDSDLDCHACNWIDMVFERDTKRGYLMGNTSDTIGVSKSLDTTSDWQDFVKHLFSHFRGRPEKFIFMIRAWHSAVCSWETCNRLEFGSIDAASPKFTL